MPGAEPMPLAAVYDKVVGAALLRRKHNTIDKTSSINRNYQTAQKV